MNAKKSSSVIYKQETHVTQSGSEYSKTSSCLPRAGESVLSQAYQHKSKEAPPNSW